MRRRVYLTTAAGLTLGGCLGTDDSDEETETTNETRGPDETNATEEDNETDTDDDRRADEGEENATETETRADDDGNESESEDGLTDETDDDEDGENEDEDDEAADGELEVFDDFADLDRWEVVAGSLSAGEGGESGSRSALLGASEGDEQVRIVRELEDPEDFSGMAPGLTLSTETTVNPLVQLIDEGGDRIDYYQQVYGGVESVRPSFGIGGVDGDPDLGAVSEIQIALWAGDGSASEIRIDDLHFVPTPENGRVMIQFDGGYESVHELALPVVEDYGLPATAFVPTHRISEDEEHDGDRLTEAQLKDLADAGWTIGSYGARGLDLTEMDGDELEEEIEASREWLAEEGYDAGYFAYPSGRYDGEVFERIATAYDVAFAGRYPAQGSAVEPALCSRVPYPGPGDAERMLEWTDEYGGTTVFTYYALDSSKESGEADGDDPEGSEAGDPDVLERFEAAMALIAEFEEGSDLEVVTPEEFAEESVL